MYILTLDIPLLRSLPAHGRWFRAQMSWLVTHSFLCSLSMRHEPLPISKFPYSQRILKWLLLELQFQVKLLGLQYERRHYAIEARQLISTNKAMCLSILYQIPGHQLLRKIHNPIMRSQLLLHRSILYQFLHRLAVQLLLYLFFLFQAHALSELLNLTLLLYLLFNFKRQ